ncbi:MAG: hypothetical protein ACFB0Z_04775 [Candidatus Phaeomarinobacter sp.]
MSTPAQLDSYVTEQIDALTLNKKKPLIVTDADEVLFQFMAGLETYLERQGYEITLKSFAITGNVRHRETGVIVEPSDMKNLLGGFFEEETHRLTPVDGAADALARLSNHADIVVLSNVPFAQRDARAKSLADSGMPYPLVANSGLKGPAMASLASLGGRPVFFLDDIPHNLQSVHEAVNDVHLVHFVADPRLRKLVPSPDADHISSGDWDHTAEHISERIRAHSGT